MNNMNWHDTQHLMSMPIGLVHWICDENVILIFVTEPVDPSRSWNNINNPWKRLNRKPGMKSINRFETENRNELIYEFICFSEAMVRLANTQRMELISIFRLTLDLVQAVSTLPRGWFWGGKLQTWHVGALGTTSALIGIYQYFAKKKSKKWTKLFLNWRWHVAMDGNVDFYTYLTSNVNL